MQDRNNAKYIFQEKVILVMLFIMNNVIWMENDWTAQNGLENNTFTSYKNVQSRNWVISMLPWRCKKGNIRMV